MILWKWRMLLFSIIIYVLCTSFLVVPSFAEPANQKNGNGNIQNDTTSNRVLQGEQELKLAQETNNLEGIIKAYLKIARAQIQLTEHEQARENLGKALEAAETLDSKSLKGVIYDILGTSYLYQNMYDLAMESMLNASELFTAVNDPFNMSRVNSNIGRVQYNLGYYDMAIEYYDKAIQLKGNDDPTGLVLTLYHYSNALREKGDLEGAAKKAEEGLALAEKINFLPGVAHNYLSLGNTQLKRGNLNHANEYFIMSYDLLKKLGDLNGTIFPLMSQGEVYLRMGNYTGAQRVSLEALQLAQSSNKWTESSQIYITLAKATDKMGDSPSAMAYMNQAIETYKKGFDQQMSQTTLALHNRYDFTNKQKEIELLKSEALLKQEEIRRTIWLLWILGIGLLLGLTFTLLLYRQVQLRKKKEAEIKEVTRLLEEANQKLTIQARTDPLTGLPNRRVFEETCEQILNTNRPISVAMLDVDYFKQFNDYYGHLSGDECLINIGRVLNEVFIAPHIAARYGGEEFSILIHGGKEEALSLMQQLRKRILDLNIEHQKSPYGIISTSAGITFTDNSFVPSTEQLLRLADIELYNAKANGRNTVSYQGEIQASEFVGTRN